MAIYVTRSQKMSLNFKFGNLRYLHVSNLQVLLVILILKSHFYSKTVWMWHVFEGCMCGGGHFEKIGFRVFTLQWVVFSLILSNRRFKCTNLFQFWHRNVSNIGAPEETWNFNMLTFNVFCYYYFLIPCSQFKMGKIDAWVGWIKCVLNILSFSGHISANTPKFNAYRL